jgi:hypothetical protein
MAAAWAWHPTKRSRYDGPCPPPACPGIIRLEPGAGVVKYSGAKDLAGQLFQLAQAAINDIGNTFERVSRAGAAGQGGLPGRPGA